MRSGHWCQAARRRWREHLLSHLAVVVPLVTCVVCFVSSEYRLHAVAPLLLWSKHTTSPLLRTNSNSRAAYQNYVLAYAKLGENDRVADMLRRSRASEKR